MIAAGVLLPFVSTARAADGWVPDRNVEFVVGTEPGAGFDLTARTLQKAWQDSHLVTSSVSIVNKPGGSGTVGMIYMNQHASSGLYLTVIGNLLLTNHLTGHTAVTYKDVTPLAVMVSDEIVVSVSPTSTLKTGSDLIAQLKRDPNSLSIAMSGVGGQNHIALGLIAKAAGLDVTKLKIVGFVGSADALNAVLGSHIDVLVAPASGTINHAAGGGLHPIGVTAEARIPGVLASVPTWKEQGFDAVFSNWRGVGGPRSMPAEAVAYWDGVLGKTAHDPAWEQAIERAHLGNYYLDSAKTKAFIEKQDADVSAVLKVLGLLKV